MKKSILILLTTFLSLIFIGTIGFKLTENLNFFDSFYITIQTFFTVGQVDFSLFSTAGRLFHVVYILLCFIFDITTLSFILGLPIINRFKGIQQARLVKEKNHIIIYGDNKLSKKLIKELKKREFNLFIVSDTTQLLKFNKGIKVYYLKDPALLKDLFISLNLNHAKALILCNQDKNNIFGTLVAKEIKSDINVFVIDHENNKEKLKNVGADIVINYSDDFRDILTYLQKEGT